ncbi:hypothetical protein [Dasineura jujubifolia toursvirus 2a]|nr:hypothetical protein [Dasineura jujubifolia toursvirus 2a]
MHIYIILFLLYTPKVKCSIFEFFTPDPVLNLTKMLTPEKLIEIEKLLELSKLKMYNDVTSVNFKNNMNEINKQLSIFILILSFQIVLLFIFIFVYIYSNSNYTQKITNFVYKIFKIRKYFICSDPTESLKTTREYFIDQKILLV